MAQLVAKLHIPHVKGNVATIAHERQRLCWAVSHLQATQRQVRWLQALRVDRSRGGIHARGWRSVQSNAAHHLPSFPRRRSLSLWMRRLHRRPAEMELARRSCQLAQTGSHCEPTPAGILVILLLFAVGFVLLKRSPVRAQRRSDKACNAAGFSHFVHTQRFHPEWFGKSSCSSPKYPSSSSVYLRVSLTSDSS